MNACNFCGCCINFYLQLKHCFSCLFCSCCENEKQDIKQVEKKPANYTVVNIEKTNLEKPISDLVVPDLVVPEFLVRAGSIEDGFETSRSNTKNYLIKLNDKNGKELTKKFTISGEKSIYFTFSVQPLNENSNKLNRCGVIIESNFILEDKTYKFMLATSLMYNGKSAVFFYFFDKLEDCKNNLRDDEETMNNIESEKTILPSDCFIPFEFIIHSIAHKPFRVTNMKTEEYFESRNSVNFIDKFARQCKIPISMEFKKSLLIHMIHGCYKGDKKNDQFVSLKKNVEKYWNNYTLTDSRIHTENVSIK